MVENFYIAVIAIIVVASAFFFVKDLKNGTLVHDKLNFFAASFVHGKAACNQVKTDGCIPDPISLILKVNEQAEAADTTSNSTTNTTSTVSVPDNSVTIPANQEKPRF
jgi:hypothetical protein